MLTNVIRELDKRLKVATLYQKLCIHLIERLKKQLSLHEI